MLEEDSERMDDYLKDAFRHDMTNQIKGYLKGGEPYTSGTPNSHSTEVQGEGFQYQKSDAINLDQKVSDSGFNLDAKISDASMSNIQASPSTIFQSSNSEQDTHRKSDFKLEHTTEAETEASKEISYNSPLGMKQNLPPVKIQVPNYPFGIKPELAQLLSKFNEIPLESLQRELESLEEKSRTVLPNNI